MEPTKEPLGKIEHIGIAGKDLDASNRLFERLLGKPHYMLLKKLVQI